MSERERRLEEALRDAVGAEMKRYLGAKRAADAHNNSDGVGSAFDYISPAPLAKWVIAAQAALSVEGEAPAPSVGCGHTYFDPVTLKCKRCGEPLSSVMNKAGDEPEAPAPTPSPATASDRALANFAEEIAAMFTTSGVQRTQALGKVLTVLRAAVANDRVHRVAGSPPSPSPSGEGAIVDAALSGAPPAPAPAPAPAPPPETEEPEHSRACRSEENNYSLTGCSDDCPAAPKPVAQEDAPATDHIGEVNKMVQDMAAEPSPDLEGLAREILSTIDEVEAHANVSGEDAIEDAEIIDHEQMTALVSVLRSFAASVSRLTREPLEKDLELRTMALGESSERVVSAERKLAEVTRERDRLLEEKKSR